MSVSSSIQILARVRLLLLARIQFTVCLQHCGGRPYKHEIFYGARGNRLELVVTMLISRRNQEELVNI
jgi:hypothetical protein